MLPKHQHIIYK